MILKDKEQRQKLILHMLESLTTPNKELTTWEIGFIESATDQFERRKDLSDRQIEILDNIYSEKTA